MAVTFIDNRVLGAQELNRIAAGIAGTYAFPVDAGGAVTANAGMVLNVASVTANKVMIGGTLDTTGYSASTVTVTTADATNPRRDWVTFSTAGAMAVRAGTAAAAPVLPDMLSTEIGNAEIYIAANDTSISGATEITDRRINAPTGKWQLVGQNTTEATMTSATEADLVTVTGLSIAATTPIMIITMFRKSAAAFQPAIGLKVNATTVLAAVNAALTALGGFAATNEAQSGVSVCFIAPRITSYLQGVSGHFRSGGATGQQTGAVGAVALAADLPTATVTDIIIRGDSDGTNTLAVDGVYVYAGF